MEDKNKDINVLVKLRKQRPAFARMISWEFSQAADKQATRKSKHKKKQDPPDSSTEKPVTEDASKEAEADSPVSSDYETAPEDESEMLEMSGQWSSSVTTDTTFDSSEVFDSLNASNDWEVDTFGIAADVDNDEDDDEEEEDANTRSGAGLQPGRRRRLSKKQKRKRSKYFRVAYANEFMPLGNLCDMTDEIGSVFSEVSGNDIKIQRRVPSLAEMCMLASRQKERSGSERKPDSTSELPTGLKKLMANWGYNHKELKNQLAFLQNYILPAVSNKDGIIKNLIYYGDKAKNFKFPRRSVWCAYSYPVNKSVPYPSQKAASFLFVSSLHRIQESAEMDYPHYIYYTKHAVQLPSIMSAFATTIDLMLPGFVRAQGGNQSNVTTLVPRVKHALRLRFPGLVDELFDRVIPYVMWARGNVTVATEMFRELVSKENKCRNRAMYLSEIARMHCHFGDDKTSARFYRLASETSVEDVKIAVNDKSVDEVTEQTQVLLASIADTGLLTKEKAFESSTHWSSAVNLPQPKQRTILAHVDSFLCYHACRLKEQDWLCEAVSKIAGYIKSYSYLYHYLSMIRALQGSEAESRKEIRNHRASNLTLPGSQILPYLGQKATNPWQPLIDIVTSNKTVVMPLNVVWRAQLQPPRFSKDRPMEADVSSRDLNLHINENGHVTGDMQMLLPPMREIELDPYTGCLVLNNIPSYTGSWRSVVFPEEEFHAKDLTLPTPCLIYSHDDGTTVHFLKPGNEAINRDLSDGDSISCPMACYWRGPDGQTSKLNLFLELKNYFREETLKAIKGRQSQGELSDERFSMLCDFLEIAYNKNYDMLINKMDNAVTSFLQAQEKQLKKDEKKGKTGSMPQKKKNVKAAKHTFFSQKCYYYQLLKEPFIFGKTIVLYLKSVLNGLILLMFINTSDKSSFMKCQIQPADGLFWMDQAALGNSTDSHFFVMRDKNSLLFYNEFGVKVQTLAFNEKDGTNQVGLLSEMCTCIIDPKVYGTNEDKSSIWYHIIGMEEDGETSLELTTTWAIAPYWAELAKEDEAKEIRDLKVVGKNVGDKGKLLLVHMTVGLGFMDPLSMKFLKITMGENCPIHYSLNEDSRILVGKFSTVKLLSEKSFTDDDSAVYRLTVVVENKLLIFEISHSSSGDMLVTVITSLSLPGVVRETCFVGKEGLLVSLTQHQEGDVNYREHVFHFRLDGHLYGVLLCLGQGPRSFHPVYLYGNSDDEQCQAGWYVYMRDGRDGILGVRLC